MVQLDIIASHISPTSKGYSEFQEELLKLKEAFRNMVGVTEEMYEDSKRAWQLRIRGRGENEVNTKANLDKEMIEGTGKKEYNGPCSSAEEWEEYVRKLREDGSKVGRVFH
jgi:hypothetical protein